MPLFDYKFKSISNISYSMTDAAIKTQAKSSAFNEWLNFLFIFIEF